MPLKIHCYGCGAPLYEGEEIKPPYEIIEKNEGRCPNCHRKLSHVPKTVEVISIE